MQNQRSVCWLILLGNPRAILEGERSVPQGDMAGGRTGNITWDQIFEEP